jgi:hypothetical protein
VKLETVDEIDAWLASVGALSEALIEELCLTKFGYSCRVVVKRVIRPDGRVLDEPGRATFELDGVQRVTMDGGLTPQMLEHPESINWGLSEVAVVRVAPAEDWIHFEALWEQDRKIHIQCRRATLTTVGD